MKIAIIGTGISGLTCAHLLCDKHEITVFESQDYIGGHTATIDVKTASGLYAIDTGFIVFNDWTYPNFIKLMTRVGVKWKDSSMSFSVKNELQNLEYNGTSINSLFAQRKNILSPSFLKMIADIMRFNKHSLEILNEDKPENKLITLGEYLKKYNYSKSFKDNYIIPMGSAIWSASYEQMENFPLQFFVRFFKNHGMLSIDDRPVWKVIKYGSRSYIDPLVKNFKNKIRLNCPVIKVKRSNETVEVTFKQNEVTSSEIFDQVIFACHSDQAIRMLSDANPVEKEVMSGLKYQANSVILHTDESVLPKKKIAWAAWNYLIEEEKNSEAKLTYNMNILQGIKSPETFCVSLNMDNKINPDKIIRKFIYDHPVYSLECIQSQARWSEISGKNGVHFCGAYWFNGFHEDGVNSALRVCEYFGEKL